MGPAVALALVVLGWAGLRLTTSYYLYRRSPDGD